MTNLAGHDIPTLLEVRCRRARERRPVCGRPLTLTGAASVANAANQAFSIADEDDVPTAFIIYTIKGHVPRRPQWMRQMPAPGADWLGGLPAVF